MARCEKRVTGCWRPVNTEDSGAHSWKELIGCWRRETTEDGGAHGWKAYVPLLCSPLFLLKMQQPGPPSGSLAGASLGVFADSKDAAHNGKEWCTETSSTRKGRKWASCLLTMISRSDSPFCCALSSVAVDKVTLGVTVGTPVFWCLWNHVTGWVLFYLLTLWGL